MAYKFVPHTPGVEIEGINIAVGLEPPEDTSKLWVKTRCIEGFEIVDAKTVTEMSAKIMRSGGGCAAVGSKIYLFGGGTGIIKYDTETGEAVILEEKIPVSLWNMACAAVGTKIYLFNGLVSKPVGTIYCFDTVTEKIEVIRSSGTGKVYGTAAAVGTKIYHAGYSTNNDDDLEDGAYDTTIWEFDTETNKEVSTGQSLPYNYVNCGCAAIGKYVYWIGGRSRKADTNRIVRFNTEDKTVYSFTLSGLTDLAWMGCVALGEKIYLIGGVTVGSSISITNQKTIKILDPQLKTCTQMTDTLGVARHDMGCAVVGNSIYVLGGNTATKPESRSNTDLVERIDPYANVKHRVLQLQINFESEPFKIIEKDGLSATYSFKDAFIGGSDGVGRPVDIAVYKDGEWQTKT